MEFNVRKKEMSSRKVEYPEGATIVNEGEMADNFYALLKGKCTVYKRNVELTSLDKKGIIFGEMSMLLDTPRTASVKASSAVEVYEINTNLDTLLTYCPKITQSIIRTLARRVTQQIELLFGYIVDDELQELSFGDKNSADI